MTVFLYQSHILPKSEYYSMKIVILNRIVQHRIREFSLAISTTSLLYKDPLVGVFWFYVRNKNRVLKMFLSSLLVYCLYKDPLGRGVLDMFEK